MCSQSGILPEGRSHGLAGWHCGNLCEGFLMPHECILGIGESKRHMEVGGGDWARDAVCIVVFHASTSKRLRVIRTAQ